MLLKSIMLNNFRQFKGVQKVEFSTDPAKNVTVIMGVNGSGKTTLAQAFTWCLYGITDFSDPNVLCKAILQQKEHNSDETVSVAIELNHNGTDYVISRKQTYNVDMLGNLCSPMFSETEIVYTDKDGSVVSVSQDECDNKIKEILPFELSKYFFFDGERIGNMSREIQSGKSEEFAEAVKNLLGLKPYVTAMKHLGGGRATKNTVIGIYNEQYSDDADGKVSYFTNEIVLRQTEAENASVKIGELKRELESIEKRKIALNLILEKNKSSGELANRKKVLERDIKRDHEKINSHTTAILYNFNTYYKNYFTKKLMQDALTVLSKTDKLDKGIPDIHKRTIDFLIKRGRCICGNPVTCDSPEHKELLELLQYIPPKAIGNMISDFAGECKIRIENSPNLYSMIQTELENRKDEMIQLDRDCRSLDQVTDEISKLDDVGSVQDELNEITEKEKKLNFELSGIHKRLGVLDSEIRGFENQRKELSLKDENNRKIELFKSYAERIYARIRSEYDNQESIIRRKLEDNINQIFRKIYNGGLSLKIDERYNVQTIVNDFDTFNVGVETSTAQSISIIFAFIAGVIRVARENDRNEEMLATEPYPLVMDAPLSAFDKERIQTVCGTLPEIAEQVIIFIKDTDGELAEKYMNVRVGKSYSFDKINEFETILSER